MENKIEEKWHLLDENEQKQMISYMNNMLSSGESTLLNLDDFPAEKKSEPVSHHAETERHAVAHHAEKEAHPKKHKAANPGTIGLMGFGMTTVLLNVHNAGFIEMSIMILAMGIMMGGLLQMIAGLWEFKHGNTFAGTAFMAYACFWWSFVLIIVNPDFMKAEPATHYELGAYLIVWEVFSVFMFFASFRHPVAFRIIFGSLIVLFFLLIFENFSGSEGAAIAAGYVGMFCGGAAMYTGVATIINNEYGRRVLPV